MNSFDSSVPHPPSPPPLGRLSVSVVSVPLTKQCVLLEGQDAIFSRCECLGKAFKWDITLNTRVVVGSFAGRIALQHFHLEFPVGLILIILSNTFFFFITVVSYLVWFYSLLSCSQMASAWAIYIAHCRKYKNISLINVYKQQNSNRCLAVCLNCKKNTG